MRRKAFVGLLSLLALTLGGMQLARAAQDKVTICHKPGTPAEKTMEVPSQAVGGHLGHGDTMGPCGAQTTTTSSTTTTTMRPTGCAAAVSDLCIDGDGFATPLPGEFEVQVGDVLTPFPTGFHAGLDLFDRPPLGVLTQDDDLHAEDPTVCPGALRNAIHDASDCDILDINGDLANGTPVTCDVETGGCNAYLIKFQDKNGNGLYDPQLGEDLVRDTNNNNIFD
jgi:hypothetical protein